MLGLRDSRHRRAAEGQALVEFALIAPLFVMVLTGIIILGMGVFYQQQLANAAREAARYAILHTATAQCPTVSNLEPDVATRPNSYWRCDPPESRWPLMTAQARDAVFGLDRSTVHVSACWSGYWTKNTSGAWADYDEVPRDLAPGGVANEFRRCTIGGIDPQTASDSMSCPSPLTSASDDMASSYSASYAANANQVAVYACYVWQPPLAGFLLIPASITLRAVATEALQYQQ